MMVIFVSQCEKNALKKTRRVLDAFANRIGDNTWQTLITEDGLNTVYKMLRQTASRSTAVSCHWVRSRSHSQLKWIVGNKNKFNNNGYVPVNSTEKDLLGSHYENDWKYLPLISAFAGLAGLLHDWGKASLLFQNKINPNNQEKIKGDPLRHEWISIALLSATIKSISHIENDKDWLDIFINKKLNKENIIDNLNANNRSPLANFSDAALLLIWIILSHHRLPFLQDNDKLNNEQNSENKNLLALLLKIEADWGYENRYDDKEFQERLSECFQFPQGLLTDSTIWLDKLAIAANHLYQNLPLFNQAMQDGSWRVIAHYARLCLMLGDHNYSSQDKDPSWNSDCKLYANTGYSHGIKVYKQKLDEHLINVAQIAQKIAQLLPYFETEPPIALDINTLDPIKGTPKKFIWQDNAVKKITDYREQTENAVKGFFIVNMASTGYGKTLANAKMMRALSDDGQSLRYILALGLRTLTLQTGDEYRNRIGLDDTQLAVLIGSSAILRLHDDSEKNGQNKQSREERISFEEELGSESQESLQDEFDNINWDDNAWVDILPEELLSTVLKKSKERALLYVPVLACTIDHIISATEVIRGGRYLLPTLRLMSSDLVIDEVDDFIGEDSIAIARLIFLAGMMGRKVMISSATITPDTALALFCAYQKGYQLYAFSRNKKGQIGCVWVDEFKTRIETVSNNAELAKSYLAYHNEFIKKRVNELKKIPAKCKATIFPISHSDNSEKNQDSYFYYIQQAITQLHHQHHFIDPESGKKISFGVVRVANIKPCVALARYLLNTQWDENIDIRAMAYHSQQVLLLRHAQEKHLDEVLKRKEKSGERPIFLSDPIIRQHIDNTKGQHLIFILVATPVEEVGRDHDFDWSVIEPSSYRSFIQLAGRVRRHREGEIEQPNIALMQFNWKGYEGKSKLAFEKPGYESKRCILETHDLSLLVNQDDLKAGINAIPRIQKAEKLTPDTSLIDLEHDAIHHTLGCEYLIPSLLTSSVTSSRQRLRDRRNAVSIPVAGCEQLWGYTSDYWWMTALPQQINRFRRSKSTIRLSLVLEDEEKKALFKQYDPQSGWISVDKLYRINRHDLSDNEKEKLWLIRDYTCLLNEHKKTDEEIAKVSRLLGEISFTQWNEDISEEYCYNDQMGLYRLMY